MIPWVDTQCHDDTVSLELSPSRRTVRLFELKFVHSESHLRNHFRQRLDEEQALQQLSAETGIEDEALSRRLRQFGLNGETVAALRFFPIAMVAWASGSVTAAELHHAEQAALFSELTGKGKAIAQFQRWLVEKPSEQWWSLWEDYVRAVSGAISDAHSPEASSLESEGHDWRCSLGLFDHCNHGGMFQFSFNRNGVKLFLNAGGRANFAKPVNGRDILKDAAGNGKQPKALATSDFYHGAISKLPDNSGADPQIAEPLIHRASQNAVIHR